jgi:hydroxypyruvate reductase
VRDSLRQNPLDGHWHVLGVGKAAAAMALGARDALGIAIVDACVVVPKDHTPRDFPLAASNWQRIEAAHPMPDASSLAAGEAVLEHIARLPRDARVLCLISGGASSLLEAPRAGITLADVRCVNRWALASGAPITTINAVRRRLSRVKGGGLAAALGDRKAVALMISDVPGDDPCTLGSGLLHSPSATRGKAASGATAARPRALDLQSLPPEVQEIVRRAGPSPRFGALRQHVATRLVATSSVACRAAAQAATARGLAAVIGRGRFSGAAAELGPRFATKAARLPRRVVYVQGGESTVNLPRRPGRGGRNQQLALSAALAFEMRGLRDGWLLAAGTDGIDGATDDAGALVDGTTCERGRDAGYDPRVSLGAADSGTFLEASGDLVHTGATLTNVGDIVVAMRWEA